MNWLRYPGSGFSVGLAVASAVACSGTASLGTLDDTQEGKDGGGSGGAQSSGGATAATGGATVATGGRPAAGGATAVTGGTSGVGGATAASGGAIAGTGGATIVTGGRTGAGGASPATGGTPATGGKNLDADCAARTCAPMPPSCPSGETRGRTEDNCCVRCLPVDGPKDLPCPEGEVLVQGCAECGLAGGCMYSEFRCRPIQDCEGGAEPCPQGAHCGGEACVDFGVTGCI